MKNYFYSFFVAVLLFSCDDPTATLEANPASSDAQFSAKVMEPLATNSENPYDYAGVIYNELLDSYLSENTRPTSLDSIIAQVNRIAAANIKYGVYFDPQITSSSSATVQNIMLNPRTALSDYMAVSILGSRAQTSLRNFSSEVQYFLTTSTDYALIYNYIIDYETEILFDTSYSPDEQALLLHTSSIVRQGVYTKRKRPKPNRDPDWDWMLTCIVATSVESNGNYASGILNAVVIDIAGTDLPR